MLSSTALAYEHYGPWYNRYEMDGGISSGIYWNFGNNGCPYQGSSYDLYSAYSEAIMEWNVRTEANINDGTSFSGTTKLELYQGNWGNIGYNGWCEFHKNGSQINGSFGSTDPSGNWDLAKTRLNDFIVNNVKAGDSSLKGTHVKVLELGFISMTIIDPKQKNYLLFLKKYEGPVSNDAYVISGVYQGKLKIDKAGKIHDSSTSSRISDRPPS